MSSGWGRSWRCQLGVQPYARRAARPARHVQASFERLREHPFEALFFFIYVVLDLLLEHLHLRFDADLLGDLLLPPVAAGLQLVEMIPVPIESRSQRARKKLPHNGS